MKIPVPFLALLCLSVTIGAEANLATSHARLEARNLLRVSMPDSAAPAAPSAPAPPWWRGFQDDTLDALIAAAQQHASHTGNGRPTADVRLMGDTLQLPLDMQVAAAYITARVDQLSLMLIAQAQGAFSREDALLSSQVRMPTFQAAGRNTLQQRMNAAATAAQSHAARRNDALALLATLCGLQPPELMARIGPALRNETLPRFVAPVPHALPAALLLQREDVALASALYRVDPRPLLDGWIDADDAQASADAVVGDPLGDVIARAHREVAQAMAEVVRRNDAAAALYDRAAASRRSVAQRQSGTSADTPSELAMLEDYEQLMLHSQQLTSASADLALTWIKLLYRLGGSGTLAAPLQNRTPPDAAAGVLQPLHGQAGRGRAPLV